MIFEVGLIKGRHDLPVQKYLINEPSVKFSDAHFIAERAMRDFILSTSNSAVIRLYITGLSRALLGAINGFLNSQQDITTGGGAVSKRTLEIWEYNQETETYESRISYKHYSELPDCSVHQYGRTLIFQN